MNCLPSTRQLHQWEFVQIPTVVHLAKKSLEQGKCVVIGLQSTGEAHTEMAVHECIEQMVMEQVAFIIVIDILHFFAIQWLPHHHIRDIA